MKLIRTMLSKSSPMDFVPTSVLKRCSGSGAFALLIAWLTNLSYSVCPHRIWNVCCHQLLMRCTTRVCIGPVTVCRIHFPSRQHHSTVRHVSPSVRRWHTIVYRLSKTDVSTSVDKLQNCLSTVHLWFSQNSLVINPEKLEAVLISTSQQANVSASSLTGVNVAGCVVPITDTIKILGVTIDQQYTCTKHLQVVILPHSSTEPHSIISNARHGNNCCVHASQFACW